MAFVAALENYRRVYEGELKLRPPFTVEFGAVGLADQYLAVPSAEFPSGEYPGPIRKENFSQKFQLESFDSTEWTSALRDFLTEFYDLAARDRSKILTDAIVVRKEPVVIRRSQVVSQRLRWPGRRRRRGDWWRLFS